MSNIPDPRDGIKKTVAYLDTIELFTRRLPPGIRQIDKIDGRRVRISECRDRHNNVVGYRVTVQRPSILMLQALDQLQRDNPRIILYRFDVAVDFLKPSQDAAEQQKIEIVTHALLKWRRKGPMHDEPNGVYWVRDKSRKRRSNRDLLVYADRLSKISGDICTHWELRLQRAAACKREGIYRVRDLTK
jgi:hypothetical protein